jgi:hypothetical protein
MKKRFFQGGVIALLVLASGVEGYAQQVNVLQNSFRDDYH